MEELAKLVSSVSSLAWPIIFGLLILKLFKPLKTLVESAHARKFTIKVAGNELSMEEASVQQRLITNDIQSKLSKLEKDLAAGKKITLKNTFSTVSSSRRILWVDDNPRNNSFLVAYLQEEGHVVDIALDTKSGIKQFQSQSYDIVISDMGRPEDERAGITLVKKLKQIKENIPFFIFCGNWAAKNLREIALKSGVTEITGSGTTLLSLLPLSKDD